MSADQERTSAAVRVDHGAIEKSLARMWSGDGHAADSVTRAALWNVVAHTASQRVQQQASEVLSRVALAVPQRTIVIRSEPEAPAEMTTWINANCHLLGDNKQVCSEEISIVAGGARIDHIAPLVSSLLLPDMPVAVWWAGDLPNEREAYVETLLDPADRLIIDSAEFDRGADFALVSRIAARTTTAPADLNWVRLEEWRMATAAVFDPPPARQRLQRIRRVSVSAVAGNNPFGDAAEAILYAAWLSAQLHHRVSDDGTVEGPAGPVEYDVRLAGRKQRAGCLAEITIGFDDGSAAILRRDEERQVIIGTFDGVTQWFDFVTRMQSRGTDHLIVRQLKRAGADGVFIKVLPIATKLAGRLAA